METALYTGETAESARSDADWLTARGYYAVAENGTLWVRNGEAEACRRILDGRDAA